MRYRIMEIEVVVIGYNDNKVTEAMHIAICIL